MVAGAEVEEATAVEEAAEALEAAAASVVAEEAMEASQAAPKQMWRRAAARASRGLVPPWF